MLTLLLTVVRMTLVLSARSKLPRMISYSFPSHKLWNMSTNIFVDKYVEKYGKSTWELDAHPFSMLSLTMHLSFRHFVLNRSMAFWFLSENLKFFIHFNDCNSQRMTNQSTWGCRCPTGIQVAPDGGRILQGCSRINESPNHKKQQSPVDHVVDVDLGGDGLRGAHHQDGRAPQLRNVSVPQSVGHMAHPFLKPLKSVVFVHISIN